MCIIFFNLRRCALYRAALRTYLALARLDDAIAGCAHAMLMPRVSSLRVRLAMQERHEGDRKTKKKQESEARLCLPPPPSPSTRHAVPGACAHQLSKKIPPGCTTN